MARPSSRDAILDAAEAVVVESGASHMTIEAVAERSGISKGGVMYNFPTKEALLEAMIRRMTERFERLREEARQNLAGRSPSELMVEIRMLQGGSKEADHRLSAALLAAVANQPDLIRDMRETMRRRFRDEIVSDGPFVRSAILFFAALGMHFHDLLDFSLLDSSQRAEVFDELARRAAGGRNV